MRSDPTLLSVAAKAVRTQKTPSARVKKHGAKKESDCGHDVLETLVDVIEAAQQDVSLLVNETAQAVTAIIETVETILSDQNFVSLDKDGNLSDRLMHILQACSFQDMTGQRLSRVVEALHDSHSRFCVGSLNANLDVKQIKRAKRRQKRLAHGPQINGNGHNQADIDALFG